MSKVVLGKKVPAFKQLATSEKELSLKDFKGQNLVLYFYPKDHTPGCTIEGQDFSTAYKKFAQLNTQVIGVSRDSIKTHENFKTKLSFPFDLIADQDETLCTLFDVIKEKNMYGKKVLGIERSTFLIDSNSVLRNEWRKVKVKGHVDEVLATVKSLESQK